MLTELLHPNRFTGMSPKMAAIVGCILGEAWADPAIEHMEVSSDGYVTHMGGWIGAIDDLGRNLIGLANAAGLDEAQRAEFFTLCKGAISSWEREPMFPELVSGVPRFV